MQKGAIARRLGYASSRKCPNKTKSQFGELHHHVGLKNGSNQHGRSISLYRAILDTREDVDGLSETLREYGEFTTDMYQST
jgi:hypothetical protein